MFRSTTGWVAVLVSVLGVLTTADVLPLVSAFLTDTFGAKVAHTIVASEGPMRSTGPSCAAVRSRAV